MSKPARSLLSRNLDAMRVPRGSVALGWLGQAGFVLKSPRGCRLALDPYLSNSCEQVGRAAGVNMRRQVPPPLRPAELIGFDAVLITHSHQDHLDPETLGPFLQAGTDAPFIAPHEAANALRFLGVQDRHIRLTWPNHIEQIGDLTIRATFAIPFDGGDLTHVGYLISVREGPRIYFTGDTDYNDILGIAMAPHRPDVMVTVINPAFRNLSPREAAKLAKTIKPRWVIPAHHDLFPDNSLPDRLLRTNLLLEGMTDAFCPLQHGEVRIFSRRGALLARKLTKK